MDLDDLNPEQREQFIAWLRAERAIEMASRRPGIDQCCEHKPDTGWVCTERFNHIGPHYNMSGGVW